MNDTCTHMLFYSATTWMKAMGSCPYCEIADLRKRLERYDQAVEVEGVVEQYLHSFGNGMYEEAASIILPSECNQFIGQRVTVLVMKGE